MFVFAEGKAKVSRKEVGDKEIKKAGRIPIREDVGPTKNLLKKRQRNVQQDTKTQWSLLVHFCSAAKGG